VNVFLLALLAAALPFPESHFDTVDGVSLHYRYWPAVGSEFKGSVLFVHGFGGSTFSWRKNVNDLVEAGYRVVAVDLPAWGYSDRSLGLDHTQRARSRLLWQLLDDIDLKTGPPAQPVQWTLVGHSMGGGTVAAMALQQPDRVSGLVLVDAAIYLTPSSTTHLLVRIPPIRGLFEFGARLEMNSRRAIANVLYSGYRRKPDTAEVNGYFAPLQLPGTAEAVVDGLKNGTDREPLDMTDILTPTLIIWGAGDVWVPLESSRRLESEIPDSELHVIQHGGHTPNETQPQEFNALLLDFLARQAQP
jgi:pimeloyl-ACP methyl ester carboxylesterase